MKITAKPFGVLPDGRQAMLYTMENDSGMRAEISNFGGVIYRLSVPDKNGQPGDVVLAHPDLNAYLKNPGFFGALVGRNCNRIENGFVEIAGKTYELEKNDGNNNLHSGSGTLTFRLMSAEVRTIGNQPALLLSTTIDHLGDGFPGNITITVAYALTDDNTLMIDYRGVSDQDTIINMTNHTYFNLAGHAAGNVYGQLLQLNAPFYNPGNKECMPTGEILSVEGTPFDFRTPRALGKDINGDHPQITQYGGYDHNLILEGMNYRMVGSVADPGSGRVMEIHTNLPAVQLYTGNGIRSGCPGKDGAVYNPHSGFCLETQFVPNAVNMPWLLSPIFGAGEECATTTSYHFTTV
jgi:aldose 1-epimerase